MIVVDWGKGCKPPLYDQAVANLRVVGTEVMLLLKLLQGQGLQLADVHLIGHSLGAHMSGYIGLLMGQGIARITGHVSLQLYPITQVFDDTSVTIPNMSSAALLR